MDIAAGVMRAYSILELKMSWVFHDPYRIWQVPVLCQLVISIGSQHKCVALFRCAMVSGRFYR